MHLHKCYICKLEKEESSYYKDSSKGSGRMSRCKECHSEAVRLRQRDNKEKCNADSRKYYNLNKPLFIAKNARRRANLLQATPKWLSEKDKSHITRVYRVCASVSKSTGVKHNVDHIIPLNGDGVCGLHVPWNLAIIPEKLNKSKGNRQLWKVK